MSSKNISSFSADFEVHGGLCPWCRGGGLFFRNGSLYCRLCTRAPSES